MTRRIQPLADDECLCRDNGCIGHDDPGRVNCTVCHCLTWQSDGMHRWCRNITTRPRRQARPRPRPTITTGGHPA